ncbi:MAG TPA: hypothetical protein VK846_16125 [Candidatus Limnocylindria bacterium]|nr:hypothetical protein [Candidatus Limnocylindria bacterium]
MERMHFDVIKGFIDRAPFRPFDIHLNDGRNVRVHHREMFSAGPTGREFVVWNPDGSLNVIDLTSITSIGLPTRYRSGSKK